MKLSVQVLELDETPTYQMKEHCVWTLNWSRQKRRVSKSKIILFLSRSFKNGVNVTKLLNQFDDIWWQKSMEFRVSILWNITSAKWIIIMEIFWTPWRWN